MAFGRAAIGMVFAVPIVPSGSVLRAMLDEIPTASRMDHVAVSYLRRPNMKYLKVLLVMFSVSLAGMTTSWAEDKCESTEHNVSHEINGKKYVCDKCVVLSCDTSGSNISKCTRTTKYTNCVEPSADKKK